MLIIGAVMVAGRRAIPTRSDGGTLFTVLVVNVDEGRANVQALADAIRTE